MEDHEVMHWMLVLFTLSTLGSGFLIVLQLLIRRLAKEAGRYEEYIAGKASHRMFGYIVVLAASLSALVILYLQHIHFHSGDFV